MKNIVKLLLLTTIASCGQQGTKKNYYSTSVIKEKTEVVDTQIFEGRYLLENGGFIELYETDYEVIVNSASQNIVTVNPENGTLGELPRVSGNFVPVNGIVRLVKNLNYTSGQDIEEDNSGSNILGQRRTDITIKFIDGVLNITFDIYSNKINSNINYIVASRTIKEL